MRILHVINQFSGRAGAEVSLRELILATHEEVDHGVVVLGQENNEFSPLESTGTEIFVPDVARPGWRRKVTHVRRAIRSFEPDVVHTALFDADVSGRLAARIARVPVVTSLVNMPWASQASGAASRAQWVKHRLIRRADRTLARHATTHFHAVARTVSEASSAALGVDPSHFTVVHRGRSDAHLGRRTAVRSRVARSALLEEIGRKGNPTLMLTVGREEPQKNHLALLDALDALVARGHDVLLVVAGRRGSASGAIDEKIAGLGLGGNVARLGVRHDIPELLAAADVFVFPSLYEGAAGAVLEAMALEVPIVGSNIPALEEALDHGRCGILVDLGAPRSLADAIERCAEGGPDVEGRVARARQRFEEEYELAAVADSMVCMYESVCRGQRTR